MEAACIFTAELASLHTYQVVVVHLLLFFLSLTRLHRDLVLDYFLRELEPFVIWQIEVDEDKFNSYFTANPCAEFNKFLKCKLTVAYAPNFTILLHFIDI